MVCNRCKMAVADILEKQQLQPVSITLGEVELPEAAITNEQRAQLRQALLQVGFELIDDRKSRIIEKIKNIVIDLVHHSVEQQRIKYSEYISQQLHYDYPYLSRLFSEVESITIEQYIISQKVEKVKELLIYDELSLSEIAYRLDYSSVAHLSAQFKKVTGMTPSQFKKLNDKQRKPLDEVGR